MVLIYLLLSLTPNDPQGDRFVVDHLAWEPEGIEVIEPWDERERRRLELEWQEPRPHRLVWLLLIRQSYSTTDWYDGCQTQRFFFRMSWDDWDENPYYDSFLEVIE